MPGRHIGEWKCSFTYSFPNQHNKDGEDDMDGHVARMGEVRNACKIWFWKPEGKDRLWSIVVDGGYF